MASRACKRRAKARRKRGVPGPGLFDIKLENVPQALTTFENLLKAFYAGKIKRPKYTGIVYGLNSYVNYLRLSHELDIEKRFIEIENNFKKLLGEQK